MSGPLGSEGPEEERGLRGGVGKGEVRRGVRRGVWKEMEGRELGGVFCVSGEGG